MQLIHKNIQSGVFVLAIALMIIAISKFKIHPFLAIMSISLIFGLIAGIPLVNQTDADGNTVSGIANVIGVFLVSLVLH